MEILLPIAFGALPDDVLKSLIELSQFFKYLCCTTLREDVLKKMYRNIAITLRKLETRFPPGFFNVMEHLPVYLAKKHNLVVLSSIDGCIHLRGNIDYINLN